MPTSQEDNTTPNAVIKNKAPAFQFYPKDVLSDGNAMAMPAEAFGIYMKLLCFDWIDDGLINDWKVWRKLGGYEPFNFQGEDRESEDWAIIQSYLEPQFIPHPTKPGYVTNPRLLKERENQREKSESAQKSANKRWEQERNTKTLNDVCERNANALRMQCSSSSSSSSSTKDLLILDPTSSEPLPETPAATPPVKEEKITLAPSLSMTRKQAQALLEEFGKESCEYYKRVCSDWLVANGKRKKDCAAFMRNWIRKEIAERRGFYYPKLNAGSAPPRSAAQRNQDATTEAMKEIFRETGHLNDT